jgi:hypothetical protein
MLKLIFILLIITSSAYAERAATIIETNGKVFIKRENKETVIVSNISSNKVFKKDIVTTGEKSSSQIKMYDNSIMSIGELAEFQIDNFAFDYEKNDGIMDVKFVTGAFRLVSGMIAKRGPDMMVVRTPVATIGIRGTAIVGKASRIGSENIIILVKDPYGRVGVITIRTSGGIVTLTKENEGVSISDPNREPTVKTFTKKQISTIVNKVPEIIDKQAMYERDQYRKMFWFKWMLE